MNYFTYALSSGLIELSSQQVELVQRLLLAPLHLLKKHLFVVDDVIGLLLVLFDDVSVVSLTLNLEFMVFFLEVNRVLFVQLHFLVVTHLNSLEVLHHWLLGDVVSGRQLLVGVFCMVLDVKDGSLRTKNWLANLYFEYNVNTLFVAFKFQYDQ